MGKKLTGDDFIRRATEIHSGKYDYSRVVYVRGKEKVEIICPDHGVFYQQPNNHLQGQGCYQCRNVKIGFKLSSNTDTFIQKCKAVHGSNFDYSKVTYKNNTTKVIIGCSLHGDFEQTPAAHIAGQGCPACRWDKIRVANTSDTESFLLRARGTHGDRYDYSRSNYINFFEKVEIGCPDHGYFWQVAGFHTSQGSGCPTCAQGGFKFDKQGTLYVLVCGHMTKVGITNLRGQDRAGYIKNKSGHNFKVVKEYLFTDGATCAAMEDQILLFLRSKYKNPDEKFHGYTECFCHVDLEGLLQIIDNMYLDL